MSKIGTHYVVVSDDAPEEAVREAVRIKAKTLEPDVNMNDIKVVRDSELRQPHNTPLNADDELREILAPDFLDSAGAKEEHFYPALNKWRKKHELQARVDELKSLYGEVGQYQKVRNCISDRIAELKRELEEL